MAKEEGELAIVEESDAFRESVVESNLALTRLFLPRARRLHQRLGIDWPEDFERATRAYLLRELELSL